jgi:hypothetical protein
MGRFLSPLKPAMVRSTQSPETAAVREGGPAGLYGSHAGDDLIRSVCTACDRWLGERNLSTEDYWVRSQNSLFH